MSESSSENQIQNARFGDIRLNKNIVINPFDIDIGATALLSVFGSIASPWLMVIPWVWFIVAFCFKTAVAFKN